MSDVRSFHRFARFLSRTRTLGILTLAHLDARPPRLQRIPPTRESLACSSTAGHLSNRTRSLGWFGLARLASFKRIISCRPIAPVASLSWDS